LPNLLERINSKILLKITLLVIIEITLIVGSFGVLAYFQSQQSSLGNSINIAGKNRYLSTRLQLQTERYLDGTSDASQLKAAMNSLQSNIITLEQGGTISGIELKPLPSGCFNLWNTINRNYGLYKAYLTQILTRYQQVKATTALLRNTTNQLGLKREFESMASDLIVPSDRLVTQLALQTDKNYDNLIVYQIIFVILVVGILILILYLVARMLKPIFDLTQATSKIKKGNFVSVRQKGNDELSILTESFNSMTDSMRELIQNHCDLTTKLEAANEELKKKDELKNEFINIAAHELRAPIQPILGRAELLRRRISGSAAGGSKDIEHIDIIIRNAKRLLRLEQNMLDMTKIEDKSLKLDKEKFDLIEEMQNVIKDFSNELSEKKIQLVFTPSQKEPIFVNADKVRILEVISNLLGNAIKFTTSEAGKSITINAEKIDSKASMSIKDTGSGLHPEIMPKLFSKFVTNSSGGTGIGLFICKNIVEAHGGSITAENNADGKGATFTFSVPLNGQTLQKQQEEQKASTKEQHYKKQGQYRKRILILDDEPDITIAFEKGLRDKGFEQIYTANDPLLCLKNFKASSYDLLIIDIMMPQMDGFGLYEEIRNIDNKVKVCFITAFEVNYQAMRAVFPATTTNDDLGCFIRKPVEIDDLIKHIEAELG
jgi:signal transduction histidine kinase/ActR/RegA family two-component response regulator